LKEKEAKLAEYESKINELSGYKEKIETSMTKQIEELEKKIPD
jgi:acetyl-CoA carboxylase alpha subunit